MRALPFLALASLLIVAAAPALGGEGNEPTDPAYEGLRGDNETPGRSNQTASPPPSNVSTRNESKAPSPSPAAGPGMNVTNSTAALDVDVWVETWYKKTANIYRIDPDGLRGRPGRTARMYQNFSIVVYTKDDDAPFHYDIKINGITADQGEATWKLRYSTLVPETNFNLTVTITQGGQTKYVEWAHIVASKKEDKGGLNEDEEAQDEGLVSFTRGEWNWRMFLFFGASAVIMGASFYFIGGIYLERMERIGWTRWMG